jgi:hypothetical protein
MSADASGAPKAALAALAGSRNADELYDKQWVDTGLTAGKEQLPAGVRGFNVDKTMRAKGAKYGPTGTEQVDDGGDGPGKVRLNNWVEGWASYVEDTFGHRNAFAALSVWNGGLDELIQEFSQGVDESGSGPAEPRMKDAETVIEKTATKLEAKLTEKQVNSGVVQNATPILIDPDFINTVRAAAPVLDWVDVVAQAGFTASYNIVSARDEPDPGWSSESTVRNLSSNTGSAFTMPNQDKDMKIWADVLDISDFAARAQSSLDFMDLEGTSIQIRTQEWATEEAEMVLYGDPDGNLSDGSAHDANAPEGMYDLANDANTNYTVPKGSTSLSGDKALFEDIKQEVLALVKDTAVNIGDLGIVTSFDVFHRLENEANINVRIDSFQDTINFGRDPTGPTTLSIANVPVLPDPNVRDHSYGSGEYDGNVGDVFIFDRSNFQRRALQALSSTALGQLGLADRMAMFQYETPVSRSQGERGSPRVHPGDRYAGVRRGRRNDHAGLRLRLKAGHHGVGWQRRDRRRGDCHTSRRRPDEQRRHRDRGERNDRRRKGVPRPRRGPAGTQLTWHASPSPTTATL